MVRVRSLATTLVLLAVVVAAWPSTALADTEPVRLLVTHEQPVDPGSVLTTAGLAGLASATPLPSPDTSPDTRPPATPSPDTSPSDTRTPDAPSSSRTPRRAPARSSVETLTVPGHATARFVERVLADTEGVVAVERDRPLRTHATSEWTWGLDNGGQHVRGTPGRVGIDVGAVDAWPRATGEGAVVAVLDTGVDVDHPLFAGRLWENPGEQVDGRDDDGNGLVDDVHGWNFADDTARVKPSSDADVHGTHVAGVVVGAHDPGTGFRGVAPDAQVMVLRFIDDEGTGWTSDAVRALAYARRHGADVVNASFGGESDSTALRTAMAEVGVPVVTSAGNTGASHEEQPVYPAAFGLDNQLAVAAVEHTGELASFSATSRRTVHVAAPGRAIVSTVPGGRLGQLSGTSMAAPFVSGLVALAVERVPDATPDELVAAVIDGARPLAGLEDTVAGGIARAAGTLAEFDAAPAACTAPAAPGFADVGRDHTHRRGIACLAAAGVASGRSATHYGAELGLTRAQVATLVAATLERAGRLPAAPAEGRFGDLAGSVHRDNVESLASVGIVRGVTTSSYQPSRTVTRGEFAGVVARAAEHAAGAPSRRSAAAFGDIGASPERDGIRMASAMALVAGRAPGVFEPDSPVRRDQAATMLVHLLDRLHHQGLLDAL